MKQDLISRIQSMDFTDACIVMVKEQYLYDRLRATKIPGLKKDVLIFKVDNFDDVKSFNEKMMNQAGWYRKGESVETNDNESTQGTEATGQED